VLEPLAVNIKSIRYDACAACSLLSRWLSLPAQVSVMHLAVLFAVVALRFGCMFALRPSLCHCLAGRKSLLSSCHQTSANLLLICSLNEAKWCFNSLIASGITFSVLSLYLYNTVHAGTFQSGCVLLRLHHG
jgi:hypothetical protein